MRRLMYLYEQIMEEELIFAKEEKRRLSKIRDEWLAILVALQFPDSSPAEMMEQIKQFYKQDISFEHFKECLSSVNLDDRKKREYMREVIEETASKMKLALEGKVEGAQAFSEFTDQMIERDSRGGKLYFKAKYLLAYLIVLDEEFQNKRYLDIIKCYGERYCEKVVRKIDKAINQALGIVKTRKSAKEVLKLTQDVLSHTEQEYKTEQSDEISYLRFMNENYRNSLEMLQSMFDELKESVEVSIEEGRNIVITDFFAKLNSPIYGNLLDNLLVVQKSLENAKREGIKIPPAFMPLTILFKQFIRFIKDAGISPIDEIGREFDASYEDIALINYIGSPYETDEEKKRMIVSAPGWKYGEIIISTPTVKEKIEE